MTIVFTDEEYEWIVKEPLNWHVADNCPPLIADSISRKLALLRKQADSDLLLVEESGNVY